MSGFTYDYQDCAGGKIRVVVAGAACKRVLA